MNTIYFCTALLDLFKTVLETAVTIVNYIETKPIKAYLKISNRHTSQILITNVRWLYKGKLLTRLVEFGYEVTIHLE